MSDHKYILKPYKGPSSRNTCPNCRQKNRFSRYVDSETGNELNENVGRCDRENSCGYHYTPKQFFYDNPGKKLSSENLIKPNIETKKTEILNKPVDYLPYELMSKSVSLHRECCFYTLLEKLFKQEIAEHLCNRYFIGKSKNGFTIFWRVDSLGRVTQGNMMHYVNGRRDKETILHSYVDKESKVVECNTAFKIAKSVLRKKDPNIVECFFGEHLLSYTENKTKPIAIVESEKTAVVASVYFPEFIWLATGGKHGIKMTERSVCNVLTGRRCILFPDLNAYDSWKGKAELMSSITGSKIGVSDLLEKNSNDEDKKKGLDIVDYLLKNGDGTGLALTDHSYPAIWDYKELRYPVSSETVFSELSENKYI
jgi:hypothetical protein